MNNVRLFVVALAMTAPLYAQGADSAAALMDRTVLAAADNAPSEGEVRKVDSAAKKITIKHGELKNLDMPAMTMVFQLNGAFTVMEMEVVK